jgi:hypothetical protein
MPQKKRKPTALQKDAIEILATDPKISKRQAMNKAGYSQLFIGIRRQAGGMMCNGPQKLDTYLREK